MSENNNSEDNKSEDYVKVAIYTAIIGGLGYGGYRVYRWLKNKDEDKEELFAEQMDEYEELIAYQQELSAKTEITDMEHAIIASMQAAIVVKERNYQDIDRTWVEDIVWDIIFPAFIGAGIITTGLIIYPIAGYMVYKSMAWLWKKRPGNGGDSNYHDPLTGEEAATAEELQARVLQHDANPDYQARLQAQAIFNAEPFWVQETIAAEAGVRERAHQSWATLEPSEIQMLAYAMAFAVGVWIASPALIPAAALVLIQCY